jgi:hypothetical protein
MTVRPCIRLHVMLVNDDFVTVTRKAPYYAPASMATTSALASDNQYPPAEPSEARLSIAPL